MLAKGKISSKDKFYKAVNELVETGKLIISKENFYLNTDLVNVGLLQTAGKNFYITPYKSNEKIFIDRSIASGYHNNDVLDILIEENDNQKDIVILGKSIKPFVAKENAHDNKKTEVRHYRNEKDLLGRVIKTGHDNLVFIPNNKSFPVRQIPILNNKEEYASFQDKICILHLRNIDTPAVGGFIKEVKGNAGNPINEYDSIAENYGAIMSWKGESLDKEIKNIPYNVDYKNLELITESEANISQKGKVVDLRHIPFTTVDPATCKDMDDAIYSTFNAQGDIECYVAVANVTKYVSLNSEIGKKYVNGGFTIYAPNKAYNILPTELSTGICSLNPEEDRLAFVVKTTIDKRTGLVKNSHIYDAIIQSRKKYSYEEAQSIVNDMADTTSKGQLFGKYLRGEELTIEEQVLMNYYAAVSINTGFEQRKMIKFHSNDEKNIIFNEDFSDIVDIKQIPHLYYHEVIEAFMVMANESTAKYAKDNCIKNIYRVHREPSGSKIDRAYEFFNIIGVPFYEDLGAEEVRRIIKDVEGQPYEEMVNKFLIRMQSRAMYNTDPYSENEEGILNEMGDKLSHYALQSSQYSHTTSPIRRVPDYVTQYNILASTHGTQPLSADQINYIIDKVNERQISVDEAERDFANVNAAIYCEHHIGEVMSGRVVKFREVKPKDGINEKFLVIVENEEKGVKAEIPLSQILGADAYYSELSEAGCAIYTENGEVAITLCAPVDFIIESADRKAMRVTGKTNPTLIRQAISREKNKGKDNTTVIDKTSIQQNNNNADNYFEREE